MPPRYPPIAPRAPSTPDRPRDDTPTSREIVSQELQTFERDRLARLEAEPVGFLDTHHPMRDALAIALQKPAGELLRRHAQRRKAYDEALNAAPDSDDPGERGVALTNDDGLTAIMAMAETQVAQAVLGDVKSFKEVAERIEGKAGLRKADLDAETIAQRERMRSTIEELVNGMAERAERRARGDDAVVIDADET